MTTFLHLCFMSQFIYDDFLSDLLSRERVLAGTDLVTRLCENFALKEPNARKILQRAVDNHVIKSSRPITFGKGQYIYADRNQKLTVYQPPKWLD